MSTSEMSSEILRLVRRREERSPTPRDEFIAWRASSADGFDFSAADEEGEGAAAAAADDDDEEEEEAALMAASC